MIRLLMGLPPKMRRRRDYAIKPKMISADVVGMDMESFRCSEIVKRQIKLAKQAVKNLPAEK